MSAPFPNSVVIDQARDWFLTVQYEDPSGTPINLTGYTAAFAMSQGFNNSIELQLSSPSNGITITPSTGTIAIHATATQTAIDAGTYTAELIVTSASGVETSLLKGNLVVSAKVVP
jgi:hypothetical protein